MSIDCEWTQTFPWICQRCGWTYARRGEPILSDKPPYRNCPAATLENLIAEQPNEKQDAIQAKLTICHACPGECWNDSCCQGWRKCDRANVDRQGWFNALCEIPDNDGKLPEQCEYWIEVKGA